MRPNRNLRSLRIVARDRTIFLRGLIDGLSLPLRPQDDRTIAFVAIEAHNLWASFARCYYISCALKAKLESGIAVNTRPTGIANPDDAIRHAVRVMRPRTPLVHITRRQEPVWHEVSTTLKLLADINASHLGQVQAAFAYPTSAFDLLPKVRHFFAHRNEETATKIDNVARMLGVKPDLRPFELLCEVLPGRPQNVIADWLDDLRAITAMLCQ